MSLRVAGCTAFKALRTPAFATARAFHKPTANPISAFSIKKGTNAFLKPSVLATVASRQNTLLHTGHVAQAEKEVTFRANPAYSPPELDIKSDKVNGSYHWDFERALSVALIPLVGASAVFGAHPVTDVLLGVVIPLHSHIGFDACITDYVHGRKFPVLNKLCVWSLRAGTVLILYGCYEFNTNDVGLTEGIKRIWKA